MKPQEQEIAKIREDIYADVRAVLKKNLTIFGWDIPGNDDKKAALLIWDVMQESMETLKKEIENGKYGV
jgi:hypothetical protein